MATTTATATAPSARGTRGRPGRRRDALTGYAFVAPGGLLFLVFIAGPFVAAIVLSFYSWDLLTPSQFVGFDNFQRLAGDVIFWRALLNTFIFAVASVVTHVVLGLALALAVNRPMNRVVRYLVRTSFFFPFLISWAAVSLLWSYVLDPTFGIAGYYTGQLGITPPNWLTDPAFALPSLIAVDWWHTIGYTFVIMLAGLQTVPRELLEAAEVDGANAWQRFWSVTLPMLSPTVFFATVITFIGAFQVFEPMFIMTNGGPLGSTRSIVLYTYEKAFRSFEVGYASTVALVVFVVIMLVTLIQFRLSRRWVSQ